MINKKIFLLGFVIILLASCKKDYQCVCTNSYNTYDAGDKVTARSKNKANKLCEELSSSDTKCTAK